MKALPKRMLRHYQFAKYEQHLVNKDNELCKLSTIDWSPFIAGLIQTFDDERNVYLLLEHIPSGTLRGVMNANPIFPIEAATFCFMNIICGLQHLYDHGIVHRDIKPENILVSPDGYLVLTDLGSSAFAHDDHADWTYIGTPLYGPPEIQQAWEVDPNRTEGSTREERHSIDIYCAGMIFFEMMYGRLVRSFSPSSSADLANIVASLSSTRP
jgi:protein kinase X